MKQAAYARGLRFGLGRLNATNVESLDQAYFGNRSEEEDVYVSGVFNRMPEVLSKAAIACQPEGYSICSSCMNHYLAFVDLLPANTISVCLTFFGTDHHDEKVRCC